MLNILSNKIFLAGILAIIICQTLKMIFHSIKDRKFNIWHIFEWSSMPSTHTSAIIAISTMVYILEGLSNLFVITVFIAIYVIDEVLWIEESIGLHSKIFNRLSQTMKLEEITPSKLRERWGHTYDEVIVGAIIGFIITYLINYYI